MANDELYSFGLDYGAPSWRPIRPLTVWKLVPVTPAPEPPVQQQKLELNLTKVCCNKHIQKVEKVKQKLLCVPGVTDVQADIGKSKVTVFGKVDHAVVLKVVRKVFPSAEVEDPKQKSNPPSENGKDDDPSKLCKYPPWCLPHVPIVPGYPCPPINYYPYPCNGLWYPESFQYYYPLPPQTYLY